MGKSTLAIIFTLTALVFLSVISTPVSSYGELIEQWLREENNNLKTELEKLKEANAQLEYEVKILSTQAGGVKKLYAQTGQQAKEEILTLMLKHQEEKAVLERQNQNLLKENVSLKQSHSDLQAELTNLKNLNAQLETKAKELYLKAQDLEQKEKESGGLSKAVEGLNKERLALKKENEELKQRIGLQETILQNERAILYEKLGTAYTQAKLFDFAIGYYLKSLEFNPRNAQVHYNLGLLYKHSKDNNKKSIYHFKRYLQLKPDTENKKEVEYLIKMLQAK